MKKYAIFFALALVPVASMADRYTHSYFRGDGTYVSGYHSTTPNFTRNDNYSTRGNYNPYTGTPGYRPRDDQSPSYRTDSYGNSTYLDPYKQQ